MSLLCVHPESWMKQIARNPTDPFDGFLLGTRYMLMDRDTKFCEAFRTILQDAVQVRCI